MTTKRQSVKQTERQEAIDELRKVIKPGDTVYTILRHVSRSGMRREVGIVITGHEDVAQWHTTLAARADQSHVGRNYGVVMDGCGMNMCFALVYNLGRYLWPDGVSAKCTRCGLYPCHREDDGKLLPNHDSNGDIYAYGPCAGWNRDTELEGEFFGHAFSGRNGDTGPWESDGGYALEQRDL